MNKEIIDETEADKAINALTDSIGGEVKKQIKDAYSKMTPAERNDMILTDVGAKGLQYMRLARTIYLAIADDVATQFQVDCLKPDVRKVRKIISRRR